MIEWTIQHPILTFILLMMVIITIGNILENLVKVRLAKHSKDNEKGE
ncbi:hypothetical protein JCM16418A_16240 [Paenibacillus pini]